MTQERREVTQERKVVIIEGSDTWKGRLHGWAFERVGSDGPLGTITEGLALIGMALFYLALYPIQPIFDLVDRLAVAGRRALVPLAAARRAAHRMSRIGQRR